MTNWEYRLDLVQEWKMAKDDEADPKELGRMVAEKLQALPPFAHDNTLQGIADDFDKLPVEATFDDFDDVMEILYDWADQRKTCWVATF